MKDTTGKAKLDLIPYMALEAVAKVREFGVHKYGEAWSWKQSGKTDDFAVASMRHIYKHLQVGTVDEESGLDHLAHAACSALMALELHLQTLKNREVP